MEKIVKICPICKKIVVCTTTYQRKRAKRNLVVYCTPKCGMKGTIQYSQSKKAVDANKKRMKKENPMHKKKNIEKMKAVKRANETLNVWNGTRVGNGTYTPQQVKIAISLGWEMEVVIHTADHIPIGMKMKWCKKKKVPTIYKVDVGNKGLKIAIEIDGSSHVGQRKKLDKKKDSILRWKGWKVLRFTNKEVDQNLEKCVQIVLSII